jgi:L-ribulose-5-phosphate 3-epimerase
MKDSSSSRRNWIKQTALAGVATLAGTQASTAASSAPAAASKIPISVSTYSYWHFRKPKYPIEQVIENAAKLGFDGVEILHRQMDNETVPYLNKLKKLAFVNGLSLPMLSIHQDFVSQIKEDRDKDIAHTKKCINLAAQMGIPAIRLNSGRWGTIPSFDDLMKKRTGTAYRRLYRRRCHQMVY